MYLSTVGRTLAIPDLGTFAEIADTTAIAASPKPIINKSLRDSQFRGPYIREVQKVAKELAHPSLVLTRSTTPSPIW